MKKIVSIFCLFFCLIAYGKTIYLSDENTVILNGPIDGLTADLTTVTIEEKRSKLAKNKKLYLIINSPGGQLEAAFKIIDIVMKNQNIHTISVRSGSAAALLVQAILSKRYIVEKGKIIFHEMTLYLCGSGPIPELKDIIKTKEKLMEITKTINITRMEMSMKEFDKKIKGKEWILDAKEALKYKATDEIVKTKCNSKFSKYIYNQGLSKYLCQ